RGNLLRQSRRDVALRKAFEKRAELLRRRAVGDECADALELRGLAPGRVKALVVEVAGQDIGGGDVELPQHLRLPGRQGFGVDRADVRVGKQAQHFQQLGSANHYGELAA